MCCSTAAVNLERAESDWQKEVLKCQLLCNQGQELAFSWHLDQLPPLKNDFLSLILSKAQPTGREKGAKFSLCIKKQAKFSTKQLSNWTHYLNTKIHQRNLMIQLACYTLA
jgi:hypothetical protein